MKPTKKKKALWLILAQRGRCRIPNGGLKQAKVKKRIRPITPALAKQRRIYAKASKEFLERNPICKVTGIQSTQVHHRKGRGRYLLDQSTWIAVSNAAHDAIHRNPAWAYKMGYLIKREKEN